MYETTWSNFGRKSKVGADYVAPFGYSERPAAWDPRSTQWTATPDRYADKGGTASYGKLLPPSRVSSPGYGTRGVGG